MRAPLALSRLSYNREKQEITYTYTNPYDHVSYTEKITHHELIARLMTHIPDPWEQSTRYYGWFANRTRTKDRWSPHFTGMGSRTARIQRKLLRTRKGEILSRRDLTVPL